MKGLKILLSLLLLFIFKLTTAQTFEKIDSLKLPKLTNPNMVWAGFNSNRLYDLLIYGSNPVSDSTELYLLQNQGESQFEVHKIQTFDLQIHAIQIMDMNSDGEVDIVFSGIKSGQDTLLSFLENKGNSQFELANTPLDSILTEKFVLRDFNQDIRPELLYIDQQDSLIYLEGTESGWELPLNEFKKTKANNFQELDLDNDGFRDILVSSPNPTEKQTLHFQNSQANSWDVWQNSWPLDSLTIDNVFTYGRFVGAKSPDLFFTGTSTTQQTHNILTLSKADTTIIASILPELEVLDALIADFNSDGTTDLWLYGRNDQNELASYFLNSVGLAESDTIKYEMDEPALTRFADFSLDGNLDFAQLISSTDSLNIILYKNEVEPINAGPTGLHSNAVQTGEGEAYLVWRGGIDSLTKSHLLSFDVVITKDDTVALNDGNVNINVPNPRTPNHGNQLYAHHTTFKKLDPGNYFRFVSSADNAFNYFCSGKSGTGILNRFAICEVENLEVSNIEACRGSTINLGSPDILRNWVSTTRGSLGQMKVLAIEVKNDETIYGSVVEYENCSAKQFTYHIEAYDSEIPEVNLAPYTLVCPGDEVSFSASPEWQNISWGSDIHSEIGDSPSVSFFPTESQTITFKGENIDGCTFVFQGYVEVEDFNPSVQDSVLNINVGESIELKAEGGATYEWSPSSDLSNPNIANPTANPRTDITYLVTITSENGCSESFEVQVNVAQTGGIANLFTPNGDGKNDNIVVFLSQMPNEFEFNIYNRSGNLLYHTKDPKEATQQGWNGSVNGSLVSNGVYFWSVSGKFANGQPVKLNNETNGKISLVR